MKSRSKSQNPSSKNFVIGRHGFAKISAVEGVKLTREMREDLREFDRKGLSAEERRSAITRKYAKPTKA